MDYTKILVPLDGSKLAETALPHAEKIAKGCSIPQIVLITVTEPVRIKAPAGERMEQLPVPYQSPIIYYGDSSSAAGDVIFHGSIKDLPVTIGKMAKTGYNYLLRSAEKLDEKGIKVGIAVLIGNVAQEIVHFAEEEEVDLIIMASSGRTGFRRWDVANSAKKVFRLTNIPILLTKPPTSFKETKPVRRGQAL